MYDSGCSNCQHLNDGTIGRSGATLVTAPSARNSNRSLNVESTSVEEGQYSQHVTRKTTNRRIRDEDNRSLATPDTAASPRTSTRSLDLEYTNVEENHYDPPSKAFSVVSLADSIFSTRSASSISSLAIIVPKVKTTL